MNKQICIIILLLTCRICDAQNLVSNPNFEIYDTCPDYASQINRAVGWYSARFTPDYFNACATQGSFVSVPLNWAGYRTAASGDAYVGIIARISGSNGAECEIIGSQLLVPLQTGVKYFVSFKVSLAGLANSINFCGINKLGILFSTIQYTYASPPPVCNCSQIYTDSIITDTLNWTKIAGSFIADSNYSFINIGRFFSNVMTDSIQIAGSQCNAYYYFDDVCISTDSLTCNSTVGINEVNNNDEWVLFPNPFNDRINITSKRNELVELNFYDITARKIFNLSFVNSTSINTEQLAKGLYLYEVRCGSSLCKKGKLVKD